jgi:hypothetical protein
VRWRVGGGRAGGTGAGGKHLAAVVTEATTRGVGVTAGRASQLEPTPTAAAELRVRRVRVLALRAGHREGAGAATTPLPSPR